MKARKWGRILFAFYASLMLWLLFGQRIGEGRIPMISMQPLKTIRGFLWLAHNYKTVDELITVIVNLVGNVVMFIPLGALLPMGWKSFERFWATFSCAVLIICAVEALQYATALGSLDIDDLILNLPGAMLGYALWWAVDRRNSTLG